MNKFLQILICLFLTKNALAGLQLRWLSTPPANGPGRFDGLSEQQRQEYEAKKREREALEAREAALRNFIPKDPWREINGQKVLAKGEDWVQFNGKVLQIVSDGIRVQGSYGPPLSLITREADFIVVNFPYQVAENDVVGFRYNYVAKENGVYTYTTTQNASRTVRKLDYGNPCDPPEEFIKSRQEQLRLAKEAAEAKAAKAKGEAAAAKLRFHQELAEKGDAYGQYNMALRYQTGDGVDKDEAKARELFSKAALQGNKDAIEALGRLPAKP